MYTVTSTPNKLDRRIETNHDLTNLVDKHEDSNTYGQLNLNYNGNIKNKRANIDYSDSTLLKHTTRMAALKEDDLETINNKESHKSGFLPTNTNNDNSSSNSTTIPIILSLLAFFLSIIIAIYVYNRWRARRDIHLQPTPLISTTHLNSDVKESKINLEALCNTVKRPFSTLSKKKMSGDMTKRNHLNLIQSQPFSNLNLFKDNINLGLSEIELSEILASPTNPTHPNDNKKETKEVSHVPVDSWDQYMSILKHSEHLHFEDIQSNHPPPPANIPISELSRHKHHPSLLGYYFNNTIGNFNKVGPYNGNSAQVSQESLIKTTDCKTNGLYKLNSSTKANKNKFTQSSESLSRILNDNIIDKSPLYIKEAIIDQQYLFSPTANSSFIRRRSIDGNESKQNEQKNIIMKTKLSALKEKTTESKDISLKNINLSNVLINSNDNNSQFMRRGASLAEGKNRLHLL